MGIVYNFVKVNQKFASMSPAKSPRHALCMQGFPPPAGYEMVLFQVSVYKFRDVKVIILGSASIGKTCLLQRYLTGDFKDDTISVGPTSEYIGSPCVSVVYCVSDVFLYSIAEYWCVSGIEKVGRLEYCFMGESGQWCVYRLVWIY